MTTSTGTNFVIAWSHDTAREMHEAIRKAHSVIRGGFRLEGRERVSFNSSILVCDDKGRLDGWDEPVFFEGMPSRKLIFEHVRDVAARTGVKEFTVEYDAHATIYELRRREGLGDCGDDGDPTGSYAECTLAKVTLN